MKRKNSGCECTLCKSNKPFDIPEEIIGAAEKGDLVLFCGAGISTENKNVLPFSFYSTIKKELKLNDDDLSFSDLMQLYCEKPDGRRKLLKRIQERFQYIHSFPELERIATRFHNELSEIYLIKTIITTNWNTYFEDFCGAIPITIPEDIVFWNDSERHVIKIHGSINNLSSIVATADDYKKCFKSLQNGTVGSLLKTLLTTKTVVFVGFSFGDDDFSQIINYLREEMKDIYPHIYFVTLDERLESCLKLNNSTFMITSGEFFLHKLKLKLIEDGYIVNDSSIPYVEEAKEKMNKIHRSISRVDLKKFPSVIYTLAYQDGVLHSFERFLQLYQTGEYNESGRIAKMIESYEKGIKECHRNGNYWDEAYYEGYANGLLYIEVCGKKEKIIESFPFLYLPNAKEPLVSIDVYNNELERISKGNSRSNIKAKRIVKEKNKPGMVVHHPPY